MGADDRQKGEPLRPAAPPAAADALGPAIRLLQLGAAVLVLCSGSLVLDPLLRPRTSLSRSAALAGDLSLTEPSWVPSGRLARHPLAGHRGVDLRPGPRLMRFEPGIEQLLIRPCCGDHSPDGDQGAAR